MPSSARLGALLFAVYASLLPDSSYAAPAAALSREVFKKLEAAQNDIAAGSYVPAERRLARLRVNPRLSSYELAQVWNLSAYSYLQQEKYDQSIAAYRKVLEFEGLPKGIELGTRKTLAQLLFQTGDYAAALAASEDLASRSEDPPDDLYLLIAQAHYQLDQFDAMLAPLQTLRERFARRGEAPDERTLQLQRAALFELERFEAMLEVLRSLAENYPSADYLVALAALHGQLEQPLKQAALLEALHDGGRLEQDLLHRSLGSLLLREDNAYRAAEVLETLVRRDAPASEDPEKVRLRGADQQLAAQAWLQAHEQERAMPLLEMAARSKTEGKTFLLLAQAHLDLGHWDEAADAAARAVSLGDLARPDQAQMLRGLALVKAGRDAEAMAAFQNARTDERSRKSAEAWLSFLAKR